jgi:hypothetical protein
MIKYALFSFLTLLLTNEVCSQGVLIGTQQGAPDASAGLELQFQDRGLLISRLTTQQRNAISQPALGLQVFNTDTECLEIYLSTGWRSVVCACTQPPTPPSQILGPFNGGCPGDTGILFREWFLCSGKFLSVDNAGRAEHCIPV